MVRKYQHFNYARPSFLEGMARVLDVGGTLNVYRLPAMKATTREETIVALRQHWADVGQFMRDAIGEFETVELCKIQERESKK